MPAFTPPPPAPQRGDRSTFSQRVDAFLTWLVALIPQLNTFFAGLSSMAAGGANTFTFTFDSATADEDPGSGNVRFNGFPQDTSSLVYMDLVSAESVDISVFLLALQSGTSNVKASLRLQKLGDVSRWILFDVFSIDGDGGYKKLNVIARARSVPNPFVNGDQVIAYFDRAGDRGDGGNTPTAEEIRNAIGTLPIANGGTGASNAAGALSNLGAMPFDTVIPVEKGGTGSMTAGGALGNLGGVSRVGGLLFDETIWKLQGALGTQRIAITVTQGSNLPRYRWGLDSDESPSLFTYETNGNYNGVVKFVAGGVAASGNVSGFKLTATSDESLKENWRSIPDDFLERFAAIERAGLFDWSESGETDGGIGAQSVREIAPWCVVEVDGKLSVNHAALNTVVGHALTRRVLRNEAML